MHVLLMKIKNFIMYPVFPTLECNNAAVHFLQLATLQALGLPVNVYHILGKCLVGTPFVFPATSYL